MYLSYNIIIIIMTSPLSIIKIIQFCQINKKFFNLIQVILCNKMTKVLVTFKTKLIFLVYNNIINNNKMLPKFNNPINFMKTKI